MLSFSTRPVITLYSAFGAYVMSTAKRKASDDEEEDDYMSDAFLASLEK